MENPEFLKNKYDLHKAPEVESAARRTEASREEKVGQKPRERIQNYLDRFSEVLERKDEGKRDRGIEALRSILYENKVIKPEEVPEEVFTLEQRIARELGHGEVEITEEFRQRKIDQIISAQKRSLDRWIDYLASSDAQYPDWAKYWAFRSMLEMGKLVKEEDEEGREKMFFQKRTKTTAAPFPLLNERALALTIGSIRAKLEEKTKPKKERGQIENQSTKLTETEFQALISGESFSKIYAQFLLEIPEYTIEGLEEIRGKWVRYPKNSDARPLVDSLEGCPLEWCTADYETAETQLQGGDFYVYYSLNQAGEAKIPRAAIRMEEDRIAEVRGIAKGQNVDPYISPVIEEKMKEFSDGEEYKKKSANMKRLTEIEQRDERGEELTKEELRFLYEVDGKIQGFGYERDPRIDEILQGRDNRTDLSQVFSCRPDQISLTQEEALSRDIIYHYGDLYLGSLTSAEGLTLPQSIGGYLDLRSLTSAEKNELRQRYPNLRIV